ncbi:MAG: HEAT repeat domain-containing protein [bacterium]
MGKHVDNYLESYIDGALTDDEKLQVEEHLKTCSECSRLFDIMPKVYAALPEMSEIPVSEDFHSRMWAEIEAREDKKAASLIWISKPSLAFALTFGLLLLACCYFKLGPCSKKELTMVNSPSIVVPGSQITNPANNIIKKCPTSTEKLTVPPKYTASDYPVIIAMAPVKNSDVVPRGNNGINGKLYTIDPMGFDKLTGELLSSCKVANLDDYKVENVTLPGKNITAENKIKDIVTNSLRRRGVKLTENNGVGKIYTKITDAGKEYKVTMSAVANENESIALNKVTADIAKTTPDKDVLNTPQTQNWLIAQFIGKNDDSSDLARAELLSCGTAVLTKLHEQMLVCSTPAEAEKMASLIGDIGSTKSVAPLVRMMRDRRLADAAAIGLRRIGKTAVPELKKAWYDENRSEAHLRLLDIFSEIKDKTADEMLHKGLKDQFQSVRESAAVILGKNLDKAALPQLAEMMKNIDGDVRLQAVEAVVKYKSTAMISNLSAVATDPYEDVVTRHTAVNGIGSINDKTAVDALLNISKILQKENNVPESLLDAVTNAIEKQNRSAVPAWIHELETGSSESKQLSARVLSLIADDRAVDALIKALSSSDPMVRASAAESLGIIKNEKALTGLKTVLKDDDEEVRNTATIAWKKITGKEPTGQ